MFVTSCRTFFFALAAGPHPRASCRRHRAAASLSRGAVWRRRCCRLLCHAVRMRLARAAVVALTIFACEGCFDMASACVVNSIDASTVPLPRVQLHHARHVETTLASEDREGNDSCSR